MLLSAALEFTSRLTPTPKMQTQNSFIGHSGKSWKRSEFRSVDLSQHAQQRIALDLLAIDACHRSLSKAVALLVTPDTSVVMQINTRFLDHHIVRSCPRQETVLRNGAREERYFQARWRTSAAAIPLETIEQAAETGRSQDLPKPRIGIQRDASCLVGDTPLVSQRK